MSNVVSKSLQEVIKVTQTVENSMLLVIGYCFPFIRHQGRRPRGIVDFSCLFPEYASVPEVLGQFSSFFYMKIDLDSEVDFHNSPLTFLSTSLVSEIDKFASSTGILNIDTLVHVKKL